MRSEKGLWNYGCGSCASKLSRTCAEAYVRVRKKIQKTVDKLADLPDKRQENDEKLRQNVDQVFEGVSVAAITLNVTPCSVVDFGESELHGMDDDHTNDLVGLGGPARCCCDVVFSGRCLAASTLQRALARTT